VSVLSAPSADASSENSTCQQPQDESGNVDSGKPKSSAGNENGNQTDDGAEDKSLEIPTKDETIASDEQKTTGDVTKEDKASRKNELALAYANRYQCHNPIATELDCGLFMH